MILDESAHSRSINRLLELLDIAYSDGPADVRELIFVSFLENLPSGAALRTRLGPQLAHALGELM